jgi:hypothetical protein
VKRCQSHRRPARNFFRHQFQDAVVCLAFRTDAVHAFHAPILNGEDGLHVQHRPQKSLRAANATAAMQKFKCIDGKDYAGMLVRFLSQGDGIFEACAILQRTRHRQYLKPKRHRHRLAIHHIDLVSGCAHQIPGLHGGLRGA